MVNPNTFTAFVGVRSRDSGIDFDVKAKGSKSVFVPDGRYEIYFAHCNHSDELNQGDSFSINGTGIEITITAVVNGNYGIHRAN